VGVHLASHGPLDHRLAKGINQILDLHGRHRTFDQAVQQMLRQLRKSGRTGGRLGRNRWLLVFHGHIHDRFLSCYASPTKFRTLSSVLPFSYFTPASSRTCLQTVSSRVLADVIAPSGSDSRSSSAFAQTACTLPESKLFSPSEIGASGGFDVLPSSRSSKGANEFQMSSRRSWYVPFSYLM